MTHESPVSAPETSSSAGDSPEALRALLLGIGPRREPWTVGAWPEGLPALDRWPDAAVAREIAQAAAAEGEPAMDEPASWVPIHAWRWLAHRPSAEALAPMLLVADLPWDEQAYAEFAEVCGLVGPSVIPALEAVLRDTTRSDTARIMAIRGLVQASAKVPATRAAVVATLLAALGAEAERSEESEVGDELIEMLITIAPAEFDAAWSPAPR
jgi:hypothetical protein